MAFGVRFDNYYLESSLYSDGRVDATWSGSPRRGRPTRRKARCGSKTTDYGDDKDRVMRKSDGGYTYFVPDVAYHVTKWERGFAKAINVQGSDHHGTVVRVRAGLQAMDIGIPPGYPDYVLHKMVTVMKGGEEVKISKRAGSYVTLRDLIDEVGRDAVRFFLVSRKAEAEFTFDIDLARSQSEENPVYYVQYAHARVAAVMRQAGMSIARGVAELADVDLAPLVSPYEEALLRRLADLPDELALAARDLAPHLVIFYLKDLAAEFHSYYNAERFLVDDLRLRRGPPGARLRRWDRRCATGSPCSASARRSRCRSHPLRAQATMTIPIHTRRPYAAPTRARRAAADRAPAARSSASSSVSCWTGPRRCGRLLRDEVRQSVSGDARVARAREGAREIGQAGSAARDKSRFDFYKILPGAEEPKVQARAPERPTQDKATVERAAAPPDKAEKGSRSRKRAPRRSRRRASRRRPTGSGCRRDRSRAKATPRISRHVSRCRDGRPSCSQRRCPTRERGYRVRLGPSTTPTSSIASRASSRKRGFDAAVIKY